MLIIKHSLSHHLRISTHEFVLWKSAVSENDTITTASKSIFVFYQGLKGNTALGVEVSKFGFFGLKKFLDPKCVDGNVVRLSKG